jgi:hypothetical protein
VVDGLGEEAYDQAADAVDERFEDEAQLREFLTTITRSPAQNLIYGTVLEAAMVNSVDKREGELLDWIATVWEIDENIQEQEPEA